MDFLELAQECEYYTSAEIENLVNVAASLAAKNQRFISAADLYQAWRKTRRDCPQKRSRKCSLESGFYEGHVNGLGKRSVLLKITKGLR